MTHWQRGRFERQLLLSTIADMFQRSNNITTNPPRADIQSFLTTLAPPDPALLHHFFTMNLDAAAESPGLGKRKPKLWGPARVPRLRASILVELATSDVVGRVDFRSRTSYECQMW